MRQYRLPPPIVSHPLEQNGRSWFAVVVPLARTNMVINGSFETNLGNYGNDGVSSARVTTQQYHGAYSMELTPSAGQANAAVYYSTVSLTSGVSYVASCKFLGVANRAYRIAFATTAGVALATYTFKATGRWQWIWVFYKETSTTTRRIYIGKNNDSANVSAYYVDGVQCESLADGVLAPTTYIDGDQQGLVPNQFPPAYLWDGTPHGSTSQRSGQTRAGGYVMPLSRYGFLLLSIIGLGIISPSHVATPYAQLDGAEYQRSLKGPRQFTLAGRIDARTPAQLDRLHAGMAEVIDRDYIGQQQPVTLLYQKWDGDRPISDYGRLIGLYSGGMGETQESLHSMPVTPTFQMYFPVVLSDREEGASLTVQQSVTDADYILKRSAAGVWSALGSGGAGGSFGALAIQAGGDGSIYAGGDFTSMGGVANTNNIARWDGSAWNAMGTGVTGGSIVQCLAVGPDGAIYAGGFFTAMGGVANTARIAKWNGAAWSALGTGASSGAVYDIVFGSDGSLYAVGSFASMGGVANTVSIAKWNGSAWSSVTSTVGGNIYQAAVAQDGTIYFVGAFTQLGVASNTNFVARYNPATSAWSALGSGLSGGTLADAIAISIDGKVYVGGDFTAAGGVSANALAVWTGSQWSTVYSSQPFDSGKFVNGGAMARMADGMIAIGGNFTTAGGVTLTDSIVRWNGAAFVPFDVDLPGTAGTTVLEAIYSAPDGSTYVGWNATGTATAAATTTITNSGSAKAYPVLIIKGPSSGTSRIYQIVNTTTGRSIFLNLTVNAGETVVLSFDPKNLSFLSDFQGNVAPKILPGSNEADFFLQPGANVISFFAASSSVTGVLRWRPAYDELAALTP